MSCPADWLSGATGGYFCKKTAGCSAWTKEGGEFPKDVCPEQCAIGVTPAHPKPKSAPEKLADKDGDVGAADDEDAIDHAADDAAIKPCDDDEAVCPDEWATAKHGGFFCRTTQ